MKSIASVVLRFGLCGIEPSELGDQILIRGNKADRALGEFRNEGATEVSFGASIAQRDNPFGLILHRMSWIGSPSEK